MLKEGKQDVALGNILNEKLRNMKSIPSFFNLCVFGKFTSFFFLAHVLLPQQVPL